MVSGGDRDTERLRGSDRDDRRGVPPYRDGGGIAGALPHRRNEIVMSWWPIRRPARWMDAERRLRSPVDVRRPGCRSPVVGAGTGRSPTDLRSWSPPRDGARPRCSMVRGRGADRRGRPPTDRVDAPRPVAANWSARARPVRRWRRPPPSVSRRTPPTTTTRAARARRPWARWPPRPSRRTRSSRSTTSTLPRRPAARFLEALVLHLPPRLHLVLAGRRARRCASPGCGRPARSPASPADLAISAADIDRLDVDGRTTLDAIVRSTAGWPLAVQLAVEASGVAGPLDPTRSSITCSSPTPSSSSTSPRTCSPGRVTRARPRGARRARAVSRRSRSSPGSAGATSWRTLRNAPPPDVSGARSRPAERSGRDAARRRVRPAGLPPPRDKAVRASSTLVALGEIDKRTFAAAAGRRSRPRPARRAAPSSDRARRPAVAEVLSSPRRSGRRARTRRASWRPPLLRRGVGRGGGRTPRSRPRRPVRHPAGPQAGDAAVPARAPRRGRRRARSARLDGTTRPRRRRCWPGVAVRWMRGDVEGCRVLLDRPRRSHAGGRRRGAGDRLHDERDARPRCRGPAGERRRYRHACATPSGRGTSC